MVQIRQILCPVDFYPPSDIALSYAASLAKNYEAKLRILHVIPPLRSVFDFAHDTGKIVKAAHVDAARRLEKMAKPIKASGVRTAVEVRFGEIDREILNAIDESKSDLIVAGTHGRRGFQQWVVGSVCERLLRQVSVPIMTIGRVKRLAGVPKIKRVLIGIDFSDGCRDAVTYGFSMAQECQANVTLLHAVDVAIGYVADPFKEPMLDGIRVDLQRLIPPEAPVWCDITTKIQFGSPYRAILKQAELEKADLIVLGTQGKSALERTLLGSNAERVIRGSAAPVLAVPPAQKRQAGKSVKRRRSG